MKQKKILYFLIAGLALVAMSFGFEAAIPGVLKNTLVVHTRSVPTHTPSTSWPEIVLNTNNNSVYTWDRSRRAWERKGGTSDLIAGRNIGFSGDSLYAMITREDYSVISDSVGNDTLAAGIADYIFAPGASVHSHSIALPASPTSGTVVTLSFLNPVAVLTLGGNGETIINAPTAATAGSRVRVKYYGGAVDKWLRIQ